MLNNEKQEGLDWKFPFEICFGSRPYVLVNNVVMVDDSN